MAILLRNIRTGFFYVAYNRWRLYPDEAFDFQTLERAARWIESTRLDEVEVVHVPNPAALTEHRLSPGAAQLRRNSPGKN
jgi:hypothetical protein